MSDVAVIVALCATLAIVIAVPLAIRAVRFAADSETKEPDQQRWAESLSSRTERFRSAGMAARDALIKEPLRRPLVRSGLQRSPEESIAAFLGVKAQSTGFDAEIAIEIADFSLDMARVEVMEVGWRSLSGGVRS